MTLRLVATCAPGLEGVVAHELEALGVTAPRVMRGAVEVEAAPALFYRAAIELRAASRLLVRLDTFAFEGSDALYEGVRAIDWSAHFGSEARFAVDLVGETQGHSPRFLTLRVKDAVVDAIRAREGQRPDVDRKSPDLRVHVHLSGGRAAVSLDPVAQSFHRRGYRGREAQAPLKESLAAGILKLAGFPEAFEEDAPVVDPMCGSGTLLVEAASMRLSIPPGLHRLKGLGRWRGHRRELSEPLIEEAQEAMARRAAVPARVYGFDGSAPALAGAQRSVEAAGLSGKIHLREVALADARPPKGPPGLVVTNPPYGARLGDESELFLLYELLGDVLRRRFLGYHAAVLCGSKALEKSLGLRVEERVSLRNGSLPVRLALFGIRDRAIDEGREPAWRKPSPQAEPFANRLEKNRKRLRKWAARQGIECYRLYDADIPEFNVAVDVYADRLHVQEYAAPPSVPSKVAAHRRRDIVRVLQEQLGVPTEKIHYKVRRRQKGGTQYEKKAPLGEPFTVREGSARFEVDLSSHLDTGLFPDHRKVREELARLAGDGEVLNLFSYTCTASVVAALGGGARSTNVDLSTTYLAWGERNFRLNELDPRDHRFLRSDVFRFLRTDRALYRAILLNPPSHSRSKAMEGELDLERDHPLLIDSAMRRLEPGGALLFSTHMRGFQLDAEILERFEVEEISERTVPQDFRRSPHRAFRIRRRRS